MPYSLQLAGVSLACSVVVGIVLGVAAAHFRNSPFDLLVNGFAALGQALPGFWVAIMLILLFAVKLQLLPVSGSGTWRTWCCRRHPHFSDVGKDHSGWCARI